MSEPEMRREHLPASRAASPDTYTLRRGEPAGRRPQHEPGRRPAQSSAGFLGQESRSTNHLGYHLFQSIEQRHGTLACFEDDDYQRRRELYARHAHEGVELDALYLHKTLPHLHHIWGRPVHLKTVEESRGVGFTCAGEAVVRNLK